MNNGKAPIPVESAQPAPEWVFELMILLFYFILLFYIILFFIIIYLAPAQG